MPLPGSGQTSWAPGFEGELIMGLDGGLYLPYSATTIRHSSIGDEKSGVVFGAFERGA